LYRDKLDLGEEDGLHFVVKKTNPRRFSNRDFEIYDGKWI